MKFAPVTVMVLPAYAADGAIEAAVGLLLMTKILDVVIFMKTPAALIVT
jgi:hypothetical protein